MRDAYVIGAGQSDFGAFPDEGYRSLFRAAFEEALESVPKGIEKDAIDEAYIGMVGIGGRQIGLPGPAVTEHVGLDGIPSVRLENACAASGYSVRQAVQAVRSGMADVALAGGTEVMNDLGRDRARYWLGVSGEMEWERMAGTTFAGVFAQMASVHMEEYGTTREQLSKVAVKSHANGAKNPHAHLDHECTLDDAESAPTIAAPLGLYHCCPMSDGAATVLVAAEDVVDEFTDDPIRVAGVGASSGGLGLFERKQYTSIPATRMAAERAYGEAAVAPDDLDFAEVHDCFSIAEIIAYEDLSFCDPGDGGDFAERGATELGGELPVNTSGGLKSKGHPIGATGASQVVEVFEQLSGKAAGRQVDDASVGLAHNIGGSGGAATVHVFEREGSS
ncbi:thiolase domain-containing protein [Haladaptatus sp. NG-SE-30]